jgi:signal transduction histidine kinase
MLTRRHRSAPADLATIAADCGERFRAVGAAAGQFAVQIRVDERRPAWISAPPDWIDRLAGVLMDNACRFAGTGGTVRISVTARGSRVTLTVEDSGPGVPAEIRGRMFDRFHRSTERGSSAGLGLAIADSIVASTDGQWRLGDSPLGGARFEVSWRRASLRHSAGRGDAGAGRSAPGLEHLAGEQEQHRLVLRTGRVALIAVRIVTLGRRAAD